MKELQKVAPPDLLKAAFMLIAAFPIAGVFRLLPASAVTARHLFSILISGSLFITLFDLSGYLQLLGASLVVYFATLYGRSSKWTPVLILIGTMLQLSVNHILGQIIHQTNVSFDHTSPMMVLVIKLTSFAWAAHDGTKPDEELSEDQKKFVIRRMPGLIEYLGYVFFFGGFLVGPAFELADYRRFAENQVTSILCGLQRLIRALTEHPPSSRNNTIKCIASALACLAVYLVLGKDLSYYHAITPKFHQKSWVYRALFIQGCGFVARTKYYAAWKMAEACCILAGLGYNGTDPKTGKPLWNRVQNISIRSLETALNPKGAIDNWNSNTGLWLRRSIYTRVISSGVKSASIAAVITYATSAFWHGFRPGFYLTFLTGSFLNIGARTMRRNVRPLFLGQSKLAPYKPVYDVLGWAVTLFSVNYMAAPFILHSVANSLELWGTLNYSVHIALILVEVGFKFFGLSTVLRRFGQSIGASYPEPRSKATTEGKDSIAESTGKATAVKTSPSSSSKPVKRRGVDDIVDMDLLADIVDGTTVNALPLDS
ncbi:MBOAT, membrane-bound O-acyltransferase family-domain-containing protein [Fimicolochytrium jonesii]|uniref:MBOAT, membrane-bound O-acyltransferase family-domain-containing protein n=1 Tax=Fimicolochytrium jonesii TaxID=1396493 RepID=UPI0022FDD86A|nr:MBOAT, membrane-bound O-acyltransferase family-domain-containing protein [Fimicolochytrium jonesii]KAI8824236.1 MBOAT, membrane-bound O-acyltransferase family-domain-containing protein [Fimicolochytrium jonesii]